MVVYIFKINIEYMDQKQELIKLLKESGSIKFGNFILLSGEKSDYFVDIGHACCSPKILELIIELTKPFVGNRKIVSSYNNSIPIASCISKELKRPMMIIDCSERTPRIIGEYKSEEKVSMIIGVVAHEKVYEKELKTLKSVGLICENIVTVIDRRKEKIKNINGVKIESILTDEDII